ncbi:hypothetical protein LXL04_000769 [Taraxacum kok-saghyz]
MSIWKKGHQEHGKGPELQIEVTNPLILLEALVTDRAPYGRSRGPEFRSRGPEFISGDFTTSTIIPHQYDHSHMLSTLLAHFLPILGTVMNLSVSYNREKKMTTFAVRRRRRLENGVHPPRFSLVFCDFV